MSATMPMRRAAPGFLLQAAALIAALLFLAPIAWTMLASLKCVGLCGRAAQRGGVVVQLSL